MKLKNIVLTALIFLSAFFMFGNIKVQAETYSGEAIWPSEWISDIYIRKERPDGYKKWQQARFLRRSEDNKFVYCLQPYVDINNNHTYNIARSDWWTAANLTEAQWKRISLIAYYGYDYSGHTAKKWYPITQVMIWRVTNPDSQIYFTDSLNGNKINSYDDEIAEINKLVDQHLVTPNIKIENNTVLISGTMTSDFVFSHEVFGEAFYTVILSVERISSANDAIPVIVSERLVDVSKSGIGESVCVYGSFRSYNKHDSNHNRLILSVFANEFNFISKEEKNDTNNIHLGGYVCKPPIYRKTPTGREIADLLIAVNRPYGKSDYIPCICWGRNARYVGGLKVGEHIEVHGRIQSRVYTKRLPDGSSEERTAYEVSVSTLEVVEE